MSLLTRCAQLTKKVQEKDQDICLSERYFNKMKTRKYLNKRGDITNESQKP
ncbi:hypothetical protein GA0116948_103132 [Chitinophaga costaii]|uniref:Uncharacterized protein n=1 Tax=Chitinophaga costaii TaxID=1335309 RepID=A0A1C4BJP3_9BACT|nr:hypothetical protein GA0116948_103132 [Chitinophaga costaii]